MNEALAKFYVGDGKDSEGRAHSDILAMSDKELEGCHNFIQWLFPTITPSAYNTDAPILDESTINYLKDDAVFQARFSMALKRMFRLWNIQYRFVCGYMNVNHFGTKRAWMEIDNHNLVRMTRVMESCRLLGFGAVGCGLFRALLTTVKTHPEFYFVEPINVFHWYFACYGNKPN
jgi:hypothetical protein